MKPRLIIRFNTFTVIVVAILLGIVILLMATGCTKEIQSTFTGGHFTVTDEIDTWQWNMTPDGKIHEDTACGEWFFIEDDIIWCVTGLHGPFRGRLKKYSKAYYITKNGDTILKLK